MTLCSYDLTGEAFHQTVGDVTFLKQMAARLPLNPIIINIGACFGTSAMAMLEARADAFIFSIDVHPSPKEVENLQAAGLWGLHRVIRILGASQDVGQHWPYPVDLCYVDGAHDYEAVCQDIEVWLPNIKPGGFAVFHDYGKPFLPHVARAIDELVIGKYEEIDRRESMIAFRI